MYIYTLIFCYQVHILISLWSLLYRQLHVEKPSKLLLFIIISLTLTLKNKNAESKNTKEGDDLTYWGLTKISRIIITSISKDYTNKKLVVWM